MNDSNGLDGIQSGDHKKVQAAKRDAALGCMIVMVAAIGIFTTGMACGWMMVIVFGR